LPDALPKGTSADCNGNGIMDWCDINTIRPGHTAPISEDNNGDSIPDECDMLPCRGDWNHDHRIEPVDVSLYIAQWYTDIQDGTFVSDMDFNLWIQPADVSIFLSNWFANLADPNCNEP
jgi:hypothetical protein